MRTPDIVFPDLSAPAPLPSPSQGARPTLTMILLARAAAASNAEFAAMAPSMSLPVWLMACKERLARERGGAPLWTATDGPGSEAHFEALATAAYRHNCAHADRREADGSAWRPPGLSRIDTSRLYRAGEEAGSGP